MKKSHLFVGAAAFAVAMSVSQPVFAQAAADCADTDSNGVCDSEESTAIVVTGSRIARPDFESTVPVVSITGAELAQQGGVSIGDALNDLPSLRSTFSQANSTRFLGTAGLNLLDLRGLGTQRTLVLVNGRRHVGSDILVNAVSPDVNTFPTDLIERVDVVTGGNSAVYGSDAIAGVVNFILKDDFEGIQLHGQGAITPHGDAGSYYLSGLVGTNFADGRGNVALNVEYARQNILYASDRAYYSQNNGFVGVDTEAFDSNVVNGSDGIPDNRIFRDIRSATINSGGLLAFASPTGACGRDSITQAGVVGRPFTCNFIFLPDGTLVPQTGTRVGLSSLTATNTATTTPGGVFIGGNGNTRREGDLIQLQPQLSRYSANVIGHFEVSPAFVPFVEAKYVRTEVFGQGGSGPAFVTGSTVDGFYERPRFDNPFLTDQARGVIQAARAASGLPAATGATRLILRKNFTELGSRAEESVRETYRIVAGFRGELSDNLNYEVSANYGEFKERTKIQGNLNVQRFLLGMDAVRDPVSGNIVCGSKLDPTRAYDDFAGNAANLTADIAACVPINPFGEQISNEAKAYVLQDTTVHAGIKQFDLTASLSGDTGAFFNLPGGPVGFAVGGEYRRERVSYEQDPLVRNGYTFYNAIGDFVAPAFEVKEAFAEVRLPLLKDSPFAEELTVSAAGRVSDYKGSAGTTWAYNVGIDYAPIPDIRFRATYARAVRAPNLSDLYFPASQNFAPGFIDPCSLNNIKNGSATREANCRAAGVPTNFNYIYSQSLETLSGGNIAAGGSGLKSEKSDSYTVGGVFQPSFVPGLSLSVDYYNIKVNNVITSPGAQSIVDTCYDSPTTDNQFCQLFERDFNDATDPGRIVEGSLVDSPLNYAALKVRGIDTQIAYRHSFGEDVSIGAKLVYTHVLENTSFLDLTQPGYGDTALDELGDPRDAFNFDLDINAGKVFVNYGLRFLSHQLVGTYEAVNSFQGRDPENADTSSPIYYPSVVYMDIRFGLNIDKNSNFYLGIDNFTDKKPPLGTTAIGAGSAIFDNIGRRLYAGVNYKF
ncbi:MAG: TonB-dependent receptor [Sphingopyxis sp.]|uniref:TonB-dependent receptor domain-containing protein n=1 Tax=Sphingopyxis sp. TaxID=1908224 RepID=UPI001A417F79|nr:TonB-dependent receptor [Sphingopyxis sp.]MBL9071082.1 TonB-dependent receptor [Sphingopyxis sp.]